MRLLGVDGCRAGWVVAESTRGPDGLLARPGLRIVPTFRALLDSLGGGPAVVGVDIPIGLPSGRLGASPDDGRRRCDAEARAFLGGHRAPSVFSAPCRATLDAASYADACTHEAQARGGRGLSRQAYGILAKIREVDRCVTPAHQAPVAPEAANTAARVWVREVHPEVTFAQLAGQGARGHGLAHPKRGCRACQQRPDQPCPDADRRLDLLRAHGLDLDPVAARDQLRRGFRRDARRPAGFTGPVVGQDDVVDALACLVTAHRIVTGQARTLPAGPPQVDERGLRMEIVT